MKTYYDLNTNSIIFENKLIPKNRENGDYCIFLVEQEKGEAELVPYVEPPSQTWEQIRAIRDSKLRETDWVGLKDITVSNESAWLNYRQALRDIPQNFANPQDVVWPSKP